MRRAIKSLGLLSRRCLKRCMFGCVASAQVAVAVTSFSAFAACSQDERGFIVGMHVVLGDQSPRADREHPLVVCNLAPNQHVRITAVIGDGRGAYYSSVTEFRVIDDELNTAKLAPVGGSYSGLHPDGYLWSMRKDPDPPAALRDKVGQGDDIAVGVTAGTGQRFDATITRDFGRGDVTVRDLHTDGLVGRVLSPKRERLRGDAIIILPGAKPALFDGRIAYLLASRGHVVLDLAYFGTDGLPEQLQSVPIEYFSRAVDVLRRDYTGVSGDVAILAFGRATEAAAMLALQRDDIARLVLVSPSSVINAGERNGDLVEQAAWTLGGAPLAFMHRTDGEEDAIARQRAPYKTRPRFDWRLAALASRDPARIAYDRIKSEIVLLACGGDEVWPSDRMANDIRDLARRSGRDNVAVQILPGCGHDLGAPIAPTTNRDFVAQNGVRYTLGGTPESVWYGQRAAWSAILRAVGSYDDR